MKNIILFIFAVSLFGCDTQTKSRTDISNSDLAKKEISERRNLDTSKLNTDVAIDFLNSYIESIRNSEDADYIIRWARSTPYATQNFKITLEKMVKDAFKADPQVGLGFDPIFDAQDYPSEGLVIHDFNSGTGYLIAKGIDWPEFRITMKLVKQNGKTLVDGCGVVNIPESMRSKR